MIRHSENELSLHLDIIVGDMSYIDSEQKMRLRRQSNTAVLTRVRENTQPSKEYFDYGCPECPEGIPLCWDTSTMLKLKCTAIKLPSIIPLVIFAGNMETAIKNYMLVPPLMNIILE